MCGVELPFLTSKERDNETGLDYFLARYYSNVQGRFTSVDPEQEGARTDDPQSWNGYGYARSSPLVYSDPDGRKYLVCDPNGKNCTRVSDQEFQAEREKFKATGNIYTGSGNFYESGQIKNAEGGVVATYVQFSIDDLQHRQLAAIAAAVNPIPMATLQFFGLSAVLGTGGGVIAYVAPSAAPVVTTLGLTRAAPAAAGVSGILSQMGRTDGRIIQKAIDLGASASGSFRDNLFKLTDAVFQIVGPGGKVEPIGRIGNSIVYGGRIGGVGIAEVNGVTVVVKMAHGNPQILGPLP